MRTMTMSMPTLETLWKDLRPLTDAVFAESQAVLAQGPRTDVYETDQGYVLEAEIPGLTERDLELRVKDSLLTLKQAKNESAETADTRRYHLRERRPQAFERVFHLPKDVDTGAIQATVRNGVLTLTLPKRPETQPRPIPIQGA